MGSAWNNQILCRHQIFKGEENYIFLGESEPESIPSLCLFQQS